MAKVVQRTDPTTGAKENVDEMLKRFKKQVISSGILYECKRREFFKPKALKRKEKSVEARRRASKNYRPKF